MAALAALLSIVGSTSTSAESLNELDGLLEPDMTVELASPVPGVVEAVFVDRSDTIKKDQIVARLQGGLQQAQVELAKVRVELSGEIKAKEAALEFANRRHERTSELYKRRFIPLDDNDEAEAKARVALQDLNAAMEKKKIATYELALANEELALRTIKSPIDGVVMERFVQPGSRVEKDPVIRIAKIDPLRVEVVVPAEYFGAIKPGMEARIIPELQVENDYTATVTRVDSVVDAASGTLSVRLSLPNPNGKLPSGLKCKVIFDRGLAKVYPRKPDDAVGTTVGVQPGVQPKPQVENKQPRQPDTPQPADQHASKPLQSPQNLSLMPAKRQAVAQMQPKSAPPRQSAEKVKLLGLQSIGEFKSKAAIRTELHAPEPTPASDNTRWSLDSLQKIFTLTQADFHDKGLTRVIMEKLSLVTTMLKRFPRATSQLHTNSERLATAKTRRTSLSPSSSQLLALAQG